MRFRDIFASRPKDRKGGSGGGHNQTRSSGNTKRTDPALVHPQSQLGIGSSESAPSTSRRRGSDGTHSGRRIQPQPILTHLIYEIGGTTSEISAVPGRLSVPNLNETRPAKLSSYVVDPSAAYENTSNSKSTTYASTKLVIDVVKESSDVFTPLKSVAGCLSAVMKHYDVRYADLDTPSTSLTIVEIASDGESPNGGIVDTPR